jgi:hypothetical protein
MDMFPYLGQADNDSLSAEMGMMTEHLHFFLSVDRAGSCIQMV